jgi:hypothetical protein
LNKVDMKQRKIDLLIKEWVKEWIKSKYSR